MKLALIIALGVFAFLISGHGASGQQPSLEMLPRLITDYKAKRVSSYDLSGGNADSRAIPAGETLVLADIEGPGVISHIWMTTNYAEEFAGRKAVLKMYWDDETEPSVLTPLNDFFCAGHGLEASMWSMPITTTANGRSRNSYFQMPFNKRARIEVANEGLEPVRGIYWYIDYQAHDEPLEDTGYFHAHYRQEYPAVEGEHYLICSAEGQGHYVGTVYSIESHSEGWWGEGDDRFFIDGETTPSLHGTGTEDYLNDAWGMWKGSSPYYGTSIHEGEPYIYPANTRYTSYRFHIEDPIPFRESLLFEIEHYGAELKDGEWNGFVERFDNLSSVAYWYQTEPHAPLEPLPPVEERLPNAAGDERQLFGFLRQAAEDPLTSSIEEVRSAHERLAENPKWEKHRPLLQARLARAEAAAGNLERAESLVEEFAVPFISRVFFAEMESMPGALGDAVTSATPLLIPWEDGSATRAEKEGRVCIATAGDKQPYIYFAFPEDSPLRGIGETVTLEVDYYSGGGGDDTFWIEYDSFFDGGGMYRATEKVEKSQEAGWHTATLACPRARCSGGQNGNADFRVCSGKDGEEFIGGIRVAGME